MDSSQSIGAGASATLRTGLLLTRLPLTAFVSKKSGFPPLKITAREELSILNELHSFPITHQINVDRSNPVCLAWLLLPLLSKIVFALCSGLEVFPLWLLPIAAYLKLRNF